MRGNHSKSALYTLNAEHPWLLLGGSGATARVVLPRPRNSGRRNQPPHGIPPSPAPVRHRPAPARSGLPSVSRARPPSPGSGELRPSSLRTAFPLSLLLSLASLSPLCPIVVDAMNPPGKPRSGLPRRHRRSSPRRPPPDPPPQPLPRTDPAPASSSRCRRSASRCRATALTRP